MMSQPQNPPAGDSAASALSLVALTAKQQAAFLNRLAQLWADDSTPDGQQIHASFMIQAYTLLGYDAPAQLESLLE